MSNFLISQSEVTRTYQNLRKIEANQRDDYLLVYSYFKENYKLIAIDLSKQQGLDADQVAIQQINFTGNQGQAGNKTMSFVLQQVKETILHFSQGSVRVF